MLIIKKCLSLISFIVNSSQHSKKINIKYFFRAMGFMARIQRALISVSDKTNVAEFARKLSAYGVEFLSTGGTAKMLKDAGLNVQEVSNYTGFPEMMDGRVKTLHPKIHGGLLGLRSNPEHVKVMQEHGIRNIDMVVVNLYPFKQTIAKANTTFEDAIENIDIGGPAMLRSAAKNFESVTVIIDPSDYDAALGDMERSGGSVTRETNFRLAVKVFENTSEYDRSISEYLRKKLIG